tara:strand:- start:7301 stop:8722 length:1422 start_codon:yes stop_codon:yes gene_type:complete
MAYKSPFLRGIYKPVTKEITENITIHDNHILSKLSGFFAQIGPNAKYPRDDNYAIFDGDGMIHGIFFNYTDIVYCNHWVKTKKLLTEIKWGKKMYISLGEMKGLGGLTAILTSEMMNNFKIIPAGYTANTAFMYHNEKLFALHETDTPYRINLNMKNKTIYTGKHYVFTNITTTTAHPKFDDFRKKIYLYSYSGQRSLKGYFFNNVFDYNLNLIEKTSIELINNGIIHDIGQTKYNLIIPDMPLKTDFNRIFEDKLPIYFDKKGKTRMGILNKDTDQLKWYNFIENFFIFHFSECYESPNNIYVIACTLNDVQFGSFIDNKKFKPFEGTQLTQFILNKKNDSYKIVYNKLLNEFINNTNYITEFPVKSLCNKSHIYCSIIDSNKGEVCGYVKVDLVDFKNSKPIIFLMKDRHGNSECQPVIIDNNEYLLTYTYDNKLNYYISLINIEDKIIHEIKLPSNVRIPPGFHSIFINK